MDTATMQPAADFEQRMQQLDALNPATPRPEQAALWPAEDLAQIEREMDAAHTKHLEHVKTYLPASIQQFESLQTFTLREVFLKTVGLITEDEQQAMLNLRQEDATEALVQGEQKETRLREQEELWETRLDKLRTLLNRSPENQPALAE